MKGYQSYVGLQSWPPPSSGYSTENNSKSSEIPLAVPQDEQKHSPLQPLASNNFTSPPTVSYQNFQTDLKSIIQLPPPTGLQSNPIVPLQFNVRSHITSTILQKAAPSVLSPPPVSPALKPPSTIGISHLSSLIKQSPPPPNFQTVPAAFNVNVPPPTMNNAAAVHHFNPSLFKSVPPPPLQLPGNYQATQQPSLVRPAVATQLPYNNIYKSHTSIQPEMTPTRYPQYTTQKFTSNHTVDKRDLAQNNKFSCETCDRGFRTKEQYDEHVSQHVRCLDPDCSYVAHPKLVELHYKWQHVTGVAKKIWKLETPEEIEKWRAERRKNFPTKENKERKEREKAERLARGERVDTARGGRMRRNQKRFCTDDIAESGEKRPRSGRDYNPLLPPWKVGGSFPRIKHKQTLLEKLLAVDIRHERNVILQCVRHVTQNHFFGIVQHAVNAETSPDTQVPQQLADLTCINSDVDMAPQTDSKNFSNDICTTQTAPTSTDEGVVEIKAGKNALMGLSRGEIDEDASHEVSLPGNYASHHPRIESTRTNSDVKNVNAGTEEIELSNTVIEEISQFDEIKSDEPQALKIRNTRVKRKTLLL